MGDGRRKPLKRLVRREGPLCSVLLATFAVVLALGVETDS